MELKIRLVLGVVIVLAKIVATATQALPGCTETCGDVSIPYPFGIGVPSTTSKSCFLQLCKDSTLYLRGVDLKGQLGMPALISKVGREDHNQDNNKVRKARLPIIYRDGVRDFYKEENSFVSVGCDSYGFINNIHGSIDNNTAGYLTRRNSMADMQNDGNCTGIGCCKVDIPVAIKNNNISIEANSFSNFKCFCPAGESEYGKRKSKRYHRSVILTKSAIIGLGVGLLILIVGAFCIYLRYLKRKLINLKDKFFKKNGGPILQQKLLNAKIFTLEQLIKATNNFDERLIIGKGHNSTVFKGILSNNRVVAIKKFRELDQNLIEEFIDWLVLLEQIRHRNVVPILGYCLDSEVPLLVYEFFSNGTVFDHLHKEEKINLSWKTRLQIATEAARALDYLHSGATIPIIHSKVSSGNILLDDTYTAKLLFDFRNLSLSSMHEIGLDLYYLDPEYIHTGQLTEKSDVYSFGVVLAELIIGEKTIHVEKPEGGFPLLAKQFILTLEKNSWLDILETGIVNKENEDEFIQVALLAAKCLRLHAKERPSMGMVAMELKNIREKHQIKHNSDLSLTKSLRLFDDPSGTFEHGSSSTSSVQTVATNRVPIQCKMDCIQ